MENALFEDPPLPLTGIPNKPPADKERLIIELEFVQNLLNVKYLNYLASNNYFENNDFMAFLWYLQYWKQPQYTRHMLFPQSLSVLDTIIADPNFRKELKVPGFIEFCHSLQGSHWLISTTTPLNAGNK